MKNSPLRSAVTLFLFGLSVLLLLSCSNDDSRSSNRSSNVPAASDGSANQGTSAPRQDGSAQAGRDVFRFETFGNEGFWTDAMRLPQGMMQEKLTPLQLLETGFQLDMDALDDKLGQALAAEFKTNLSAAKAPMLHDPAVTLQLVQANAVIGIVAKDSNDDGKIDLLKGDKVGVSCAICHTITDASVYEMRGKGSAGRRLDGRGNFALDMGKALAVAANSRAYYPNLQLELSGKTIGPAPRGIRVDSTEAEVDSYLKNSRFYPPGTFDETQDGIGNPVQNTPLFRQDLAAPYGSNGLHEKLEGITNASYTTNLDPTTLATHEGRQLLMQLAGKNGEELYNNYVQILKETGVTGYPFVRASMGHEIGHRDTPVGRKVDEQRVLDLKAYMIALPISQGVAADASAQARGRKVFQANCTQCHNSNQSKPVTAKLFSLKEMWPAYTPVMLAMRKPPLSPIEDSPGGYDDKMVILEASQRGKIRGVSAPLLLDLARKPAFLHDGSVSSLDNLLDPKRGAREPHPFFLSRPKDRKDVVEFLRSLEARSSVNK